MSNGKSFDENLKYGEDGEFIVDELLKKKGFYTIPKYLYVKKGAPSLFGLNNNIPVPDIDVSGNERFWLEVKRKERMHQHPATGFSSRIFNCYLEVQKITKTPVYILFIDKLERKCYGNWINVLNAETNIYRKDWVFEGQPHIVFKYPSAFNFDFMDYEEINSLLTTK